MDFNNQPLKHFKAQLIFCLFVLASVIPISVNAQICDPDDPDPLCLSNNNHDFRPADISTWSCSGNDVNLVSLRVEDPDQTGQCVECNTGDVVTWDLIATISFGQNGNRSCFAIAGDLSINGMPCCTFSRVNSDACVSGAANTTQEINFGTISFICGDGLELSNVVVGWASNCNTGCNDGSYTPGTSKCATLASLTIETPLGANCSATPGTCAGDDGTIEVIATGGDGNYIYQWQNEGGQNVGNTSSLSVPAGTYYVTVTDGDLCVESCSVVLADGSDNTPPTASCQNITVQLDANGMASITTNDIDAGSSDNCGIASSSVSPNTFNCSNIGANTVILTVTDNSGLQSTCTATVTVEDNIPPNAMCQNLDLYLDASGNASLMASDIDNGSSDNCGVESLVISQEIFGCDDEGSNTVTLTVTDVNGNVSTCMSSVNVYDTISPTALCSNITIPLDGTGMASISPVDINNGSFDNCSIASITVSPNTFSCADIGPNSVTLTVEDEQGNVGTCTALVTVEDNGMPTAMCRDIIIQLDANGQASITAADIDDGSGDACGNVTTTVAPSSFTCTNVGTNMVTLTVTDANSNTTTCTAQVTVEDNIPPQVITQNITIQLDASGLASISPSDIDNGSSDACGIATMTVAPNTFGCGNTGTNTVVLTVTDVNGNTSTGNAVVTVEDNIDPILVCPTTDITVNNDPGLCGAIVIFTTTADDNCTFTLDCTHNSGDFFPVGTTTVTCTATDLSGNSVMCSFNVIVSDNQAPGLTCPPDITLTCTDPTDPSNTGMATSSDICSGDATITHQDITQQGSCLNNYVIERTWTATDDAGNQNTCVQRITVEDNTPPLITCPPNITVPCEANIPAPDISQVFASDNCSGLITIEHVDDVPAATNPPTISRTYMATDVCGNSNTCTQTITIENNNAPSINCPSPITVQCRGDVPPADPDAIVATGTCGNPATVSLLSEIENGTCPTIITRTYQALDSDGNTATCQHIITIADTIAPVIAFQLADADMGCSNTQAPSTASLPIATSDPVDFGASDNCTAIGDLMVTSHDTGPFIDGCAYIFERVYTITDECGNSTSTLPQVFVFTFDNEPPSTATSLPNILYGCDETVPPVSGTPVFTDNCPGEIIISYEERSGSAGCLTESYQRIWTATDQCGNSSQAIQYLGKTDFTPPVIERAPDTTITCGQDIPEPEFLITEDCSPFEQSYQSTIIPGDCACNYTIMRTWHAVNRCQVEVRDTQFIYVVDTIAPDITITNPMLSGIENGGTMVMYGCLQPQVLMTDIEVDDCCGIDNIETYDSLLSYGTCEVFDYFARWVCGYVVTDPCGNQSEFRFYVEQVDTVAPKFIVDGFEEEISIACTDTIPDIPEVTIADNCDLVPVIQFSADTLGFFPDSFAIVRRWEAMDACNNASVLQQTINFCGYDGSTVMADIGNRVWHDENGNGIQDPDERGLNGVHIELVRDQDGDGMPDAATYKSSVSARYEGQEGTYHFENLEPGYYFIKVIPQEDLELSPMHQASDELDSDIDPSTNYSPIILLEAGQSYLDVDIGLSKLFQHAVDLGTFRGQADNCINRIQWSSFAEINNATFLIERKNHQGDFESIGELSGAENSDTRINYEFIDKDPLVASTYRLVMIATDGSRRTWEEDLTVFKQCQQGLQVIYYPNPAINQFIIEHTMDNAANYSYELTDLLGRSIQKWRKQGFLGTSRQEIDITLQPEGIYFLKVSDGQRSLTRRIVKVSSR